VKDASERHEDETHRMRPIDPLIHPLIQRLSRLSIPDAVKLLHREVT
jgi:hypothetical protein